MGVRERVCRSQGVGVGVWVGCRGVGEGVGGGFDGTIYCGCNDTYLYALSNKGTVLCLHILICVQFIILFLLYCSFIFLFLFTLSFVFLTIFFLLTYLFNLYHHHHLIYSYFHVDILFS